MKRIITFLVCTYIVTALDAQQGAIYNLYFHDHYYVNPAAAGANGQSNFNINAKEFWLGFPENTPGNQSIVFHSMLNKSNNGRKKYGRRRYGSRKMGGVALGAMLYNDYNGPIRKTGILTSYAYHIALNGFNLSFGLSTYAYQFLTDKREINLKNKNDLFYSESDYFYGTDANLGIYLSSNEYYLSLTSYGLTQSKIRLKGSDLIDYAENRKYSVLTGYAYEMNRDLYIEPSLYFQTDEYFNMRMELNLMMTFSEKIWAGFGISSHSTLSLFTGYISEQFDFGYAFQLPNHDILEYSFGSHEVMFGIKFGQGGNKYSRGNSYNRRR